MDKDQEWYLANLIDSLHSEKVLGPDRETLNLVDQLLYLVNEAGIANRRGEEAIRPALEKITSTLRDISWTLHRVNSTRGTHKIRIEEILYPGGQDYGEAIGEIVDLWESEVDPRAPIVKYSVEVPGFKKREVLMQQGLTWSLEPELEEGIERMIRTSDLGYVGEGEVDGDS